MVVPTYLHLSTYFVPYSIRTQLCLLAISVWLYLLLLLLLSSYFWPTLCCSNQFCVCFCLCISSSSLSSTAAQLCRFSSKSSTCKFCASFSLLFTFCTVHRYLFAFHSGNLPFAFTRFCCCCCCSFCRCVLCSLFSPFSPCFSSPLCRARAMTIFLWPAKKHFVKQICVLNTLQIWGMKKEHAKQEATERY